MQTTVSRRKSATRTSSLRRRLDTRRITRCVVIIATAALFSSTGCALKKLETELSQFQDMTRISGRVSDGELGRGAIVLVFHDEISQRSLVNYRIVPEKGAFVFYVKPGAYFIVAFTDSNTNFKYDHGEPLACYGAPSRIDATPGTHYSDLTVSTSLSSGIAADFTIDVSHADSSPSLSRFRENVGAIVDFDDDRLAARHGKTGLWQPSRFLNEVGGGIFFLEPYDPAKIPVLFIHGSNGSPQNFRFLVEHLDRESFQPWLLFYPSALRLELLGDRLDEFVDDLHTQHKFSQMAVVAHSMGGLVARSFINASVLDHDRTYVKLFVSISTPWGGHAAARLGAERVSSDWLSWIDLVPGSQFLESLFVMDIASLVDHHLMFSYQGHSIFTEGNDDGAVSIASQLEPRAQAAAKRIYGFDRNHVQILSDKSVSDIVNRILAQMQK